MRKSILLCLTFTLSMSSLIAQTNETLLKRKGLNISTNLSYTHSLEGYFNRTISTGNSVSEQMDLSSQANFSMDLFGIAEYMILPAKLSIGLGTGYFQTINPNFAIVPLFFDTKLYVFRDRRAVYLNAQMGLSAKIGDAIAPAQYYRLGAGYRFMLMNHSVGLEAGANVRKAAIDGAAKISDSMLTAEMSGYYATFVYLINPVRKSN
jgi:hypothetical protein